MRHAAPAHGTLRRAVALLDVDRRRVVLALVLGTLALGCAVALAGTAAWLIARASQMPPVLELGVATVAVRAFGIGRGVLRYLERLVSHDVALRGMTQLRTTLYERLAVGRPETLLRLRRGDLLARVGADVDAVGDVVVRGLLPIGVATVLGLLTSVAMCLFWPPAGLALAGCLLLAGVVGPYLASRGARITEELAVQGQADMTAAALGLLDDAGPLLVAGRVRREMAELKDADARIVARDGRGCTVRRAGGGDRSAGGRSGGAGGARHRRPRGHGGAPRGRRPRGHRAHPARSVRGDHTAARRDGAGAPVARGGRPRARAARRHGRPGTRRGRPTSTGPGARRVRRDDRLAGRAGGRRGPRPRAGTGPVGRDRRPVGHRARRRRCSRSPAC